MMKRISTGGVVWAVFVVAVVYCASAWVYPVFFMRELAPPRIEQIALAPQSETATVRTPLATYEQMAAGRKIFDVLLVEAAPGPGEKTLAEVLAELKLLGVISGKDQQAVFEDTKTQKSMYLREGDSVGSLIIEKIENGVVTVSYGGEFVELRI